MDTNPELTNNLKPLLVKDLFIYLGGGGQKEREREGTSGRLPAELGA